MWNVKTKAMPIIIGATGTTSKLFRQHLSNIPGTTKNSHIGHCTHTAESADVKVRNIFHVRNNITWSKNCKYRTAVTLYALDTLFQVCNCKYPA